MSGHEWPPHTFLWHVVLNHALALKRQGFLIWAVGCISSQMHRDALPAFCIRSNIFGWFGADTTVHQRDVRVDGVLRFANIHV